MCLFAATAFADARGDVEKLVRQHLGGDDKVVTADAAIVVHGAQTDAPWLTELAGDRIGMTGELSVRVDKIEVRVDGGVAWFAVNGNLVVKNGKDNGKFPLRVNGVALEQAKAWKIAAIGHSLVVTDKVLFDTSNTMKRKLAPPTAAPKVTGDAALAAAAVDWVDKGGLGKAGGARAESRLAMGTAPAEFQAGAGTSKLTGIWDKLKMRVVEIDAKKLSDKAGWVRARVALPIPKSKNAAPVVLTAVAVPDGAGWRWVSLHWASNLPVWTAGN